jgi:hypothetical protein
MMLEFQMSLKKEALIPTGVPLNFVPKGKAPKDEGQGEEGKENPDSAD